MNKRRLLKDWQEGLEYSVRYFSNENKPARECWVARTFLENLDLEFHEKEVVSVVQPDDVDVVFRNARFQIKDILDPGRKRHLEFKQLLRKSLTTKDPTDLLGPCTFIQDLTPEDILQLIEKGLRELEKAHPFPPKVKAELDLLFYINLIHHVPKIRKMPDSHGFSKFGWRSISALFGWASLVYYANDAAPAFLQEKRGQLIMKKF